MRICSLAAISTESARSNAGVLAAYFIGAEVNPDSAVRENELRVARSRIILDAPQMAGASRALDRGEQSDLRPQAGFALRGMGRSRSVK